MIIIMIICHLVHVEQWVQGVDLVRFNEPLGRLIPALSSHLVSELIHPGGGRRQSDTATSVEANLLYQ